MLVFLFQYHSCKANPSLRAGFKKIERVTKYFEIMKLVKSVSNVKIKKYEVYNGDRKNFQSHEENWLIKELVEKKLRELKPKCCFDRVPLVF
jgi:hypothetical protein